MLLRKITKARWKQHPVEAGCTIEVDILEVGADTKGQSVVESFDSPSESVVVVICTMFRHG